MNKRYFNFNLFLSILGMVFFIFICSCKNEIEDRDKDGIEDSVDKCPDIAGDSINNGCPEIKKIDFYIETSASMNGYFNGETKFKEIVTGLVALLESKIDPKRDTNVSIYYIDSKIPRPFTSSKSEFYQQISNTQIAKGRGSELHEIFKTVTQDLSDSISKGTIKILVSDCILSYPTDMVKKNREINKVNAATGLKNDIFEAFSLLANNGINAAVYAFKSEFDGMYYNYKNDTTKLKNNDRPFYFWFFGRENELDYFFNSFFDKKTLKQKYNFEELFFKSNDSKSLNLEYAENIQNKKNKNGIHVFGGCDVSVMNKVFNVKVKQRNSKNSLILFYGLEYYGLDTVIVKKILDSINEYVYNNEESKVNIMNVTSNDRIDIIRYNEETQSPERNYLYYLKFELPKTIYNSSSFSINIPYLIPPWCYAYSIDDDSRVDSITGKTFAFKYLVEGIHEAYYPANSTSLLKNTFNISN